MASPSRVCAFSLTRSCSISASNVARSTTAGRGALSTFMTFSSNSRASHARGDVEVVPGVAHLFVAAVVDEVRAEHKAVVVADECVGAVPLVDAEVLVEVVEHRDPGDVLPAHALLHALDVGPRGARREHER